MQTKTPRWENEFSDKYTVHENVPFFCTTFLRSRKKALQFRCDIIPDGEIVDAQCSRSRKEDKPCC